jgi:hypothetical protein
VFSKVIVALLDHVRGGGTLADMTATGRTALAEDSGQTASLNRLMTVFKAATPAQQAKFITSMALLTAGKLERR